MNSRTGRVRAEWVQASRQATGNNGRTTKIHGLRLSFGSFGHGQDAQLSPYSYHGRDRAPGSLLLLLSVGTCFHRTVSWLFVRRQASEGGGGGGGGHVAAWSQIAFLHMVAQSAMAAQHAPVQACTVDSHRMGVHLGRQGQTCCTGSIQ